MPRHLWFSMVAFACLAGCNKPVTQSRAPGQPTMNELMHQRAEESKRTEEKRRASMEQARQLPPAEVAKLEAGLRTSPDDQEVREKLFLYYGFKQDWPNQNRHMLWGVDHPASRISSYPPPDPAVNRSGFEAGRQRRLARLKASGRQKIDKDVYGHRGPIHFRRGQTAG